LYSRLLMSLLQILFYTVIMINKPFNFMPEYTFYILSGHKLHPAKVEVIFGISKRRVKSSGQTPENNSMYFA
jgi:hypothetical protein